MKKKILFTSILLFGFGFSFSLNGFNNSFEDKQNNVKKSQKPPSSTDEPLTIEWGISESTHEPEMIVTPTTATVEYDYKNRNDIDKDGIWWIGDDYDENKQYDFDDQVAKREELKDNGDFAMEGNDYTYHGFLTKENLEKDHSYEDSYLQVGTEYTSAPYKTEPKFDFATPTQAKEPDDFHVEQAEVITTNNSAKLTFNFSPSTANYTRIYTDSHQNQKKDLPKEATIPPVKAEWVTSDGTVLGSTTDFNLDDENPTPPAANQEEYYNATITIDEKSYPDIGPNQTYEDTKIIIYDEFATYEPDPESYLYQSNSFDVSTKEKGNIPTEIEKPTVKVDSYEAATLTYEIDPGTDKFGNDLIVTKIRWEDSEDGGYGNFPSKEIKGEEISKPEDDLVKGTITQTVLSPYTDYKTQLTVTVKDESGAKEELDPIQVDRFRTKNKIVDGKISIENAIDEDGEIDGSGEYKHEQNIDYFIEPTEKNGEDIEPEKIEVYSEGSIIYTENNPISNDTTTMKITGLQAGTTYNDISLFVTDEEQNTYETTEYFWFETRSGESNGKVSSGTTINTDETTKTTAEVTYTIEEELDPQETPIPAETITWVDSSGKELGNATKTNPGTSGNLTATGLTPGTTYTDTYLIVNKDLPNEFDSKSNRIEPFTTEDGTEPGTIDSDQEITINKENPDPIAATVGFDIDPAKDNNGMDNEIKKIVWKDENGKAFKSQNYDYDGNTNTGEITASGLDLDTYSRTYLEVTDDNGGEYNKLTIDTFSTYGNDYDGEVTNGDPIYCSNPDDPATEASINYEINYSTNADGVPIIPDKITWIDKNGDELGGTGNASNYNPGTSGIIEAKNLTLGTRYNDTKLKVEYIDDNEETQYYCSKVESEFTTDSGQKDGSITSVGEPTTKGDSATIEYRIEPEYDKHAAVVKTTKVQWVVKGKGAYGEEKIIVLAEEEPDNWWGGTMTTNVSLPLNTTIDDTYLIMTNANGDIPSDTFTLNTGNFKTKKMVIGGSALGIAIVILAIISFFAYTWRKKRKVN